MNKMELRNKRVNEQSQNMGGAPPIILPKTRVALRVSGSIAVMASFLLSGQAFAACVESAPAGSNIWTCSVPEITTQTFSGLSPDVTLNNGATIITAAGNAVTLSSTGGLVFTTIDAVNGDGGAIVGAGDGIDAENAGGGALTIEVNNVEGIGRAGIFADGLTGTTDVSVTATGTVKGRRNGIRVQNDGTGKTTVMANNVEGGIADGIVVDNTVAAMGDVTVISTGLVKGVHGIYADNHGSGWLIVEANEAVGTVYDGIFAENQKEGKGISVTAKGDVTGAEEGIYARNWGGTATVVAYENVVGETLNGIQVFNEAEGTDISVTAMGDVTGGEVGQSSFYSGINVWNEGTGDTTVEATKVDGIIEGISGRGIYASIRRNAAATGNVRVTAAGLVKGATTGIEARNEGTGAIIVEANNVEGISGRGIYAYNTTGGATGEVRVTAAGLVTGATEGIRAENLGSGATTVNANNVVGTSGSGIYVFNAAGEVSVTTTGLVTGATDGISAENLGSGALIVDVNNVVGMSLHGIRAVNSTDATHLNVTATGDVTGATDGIYAENYGSGGTAVLIESGTVTGGSGAGIHTIAALGGTIDIAAAAVVESASGIAIRDGDEDDDGVDEIGGNVIVTTLGTVTGDAILGLGDDVFNLTGGEYSGDIYGDDVLASAADGDDAFNWSGGELNSSFFGGNGSDTATISGAAIYDGTEILDGGDNYSIADGWIDTLTFQGITATTTASTTLLNWENIIIDGGAITIDGGLLEVGVASEASTGLVITNAGILDAGAALALTGNLTTTAGGTFDGTGGGAGVYSVSGSVLNDGIITTQDGVVGDVFTIAGDYAGTGQLLVDADFATDTSDAFNIVGDVTGAGTQVSVQDVSTGESTGNDVIVVTVGGATAAGDFALAAPVISGAFNYNTLEQDGQNWVLQSIAVPVVTVPMAKKAYTPIASAFEGFGRSLLTLETLPTLNQRQSIRNDRGNLSHAETGTAMTSETPFWLRVEGGESNIDSDKSTTSADFDTEFWRVQVGANKLLMDNDDGRFIAGINFGYSDAETDISAQAGHSDIETDGLSLGLTGTWYAATGGHYEGLYIDTQAQRSWYESDLSGNAVKGAENGEGADTIKDIDSDGYSASIEVGKRIPLQAENNLSITPQAQLVYSKVDFDGFTGKNNVIVDSGDAKSLKARIGLTLDSQIYHKEGSSTQGYLLTNVIHEFENDSQAIVTGTKLSNDVDRWRGEAGGGLSHVWYSRGGKTTYELFGEVTGSTSLNNVGDSNAVKGTLGFRVKF